MVPPGVAQRVGLAWAEELKAKENRAPEGVGEVPCGQTTQTRTCAIPKRTLHWIVSGPGYLRDIPPKPKAPPKGSPKDSFDVCRGVRCCAARPSERGAAPSAASHCPSNRG